MLRNGKTKLLLADSWHSANISCGLTGVTVLHNWKFSSRYKGSKSLLVNPEGELYQKIKRKPEPKEEPRSRPKPMYRINKSEIRHRVAAMVNSQTGQRKLLMLTMSFPPCITEERAYRLFNSFKTTLRQSFLIKHYIWVRENQQNGTPHFHILIRDYINIKAANTVIKNLLHYEIRHHKLEWSHTEASIYNGLDLSKNRNTKKVVNYCSSKGQNTIAGYISKYCSKSTNSYNRQAWQSSKSVSSYFTHINLTLDEFLSLHGDKIDIEDPLFVDTMYCFYKWSAAPPHSITAQLNKVNNSTPQKLTNPILDRTAKSTPIQEAQAQKHNVFLWEKASSHTAALTLFP